MLKSDSRNAMMVKEENNDFIHFNKPCNKNDLYMGCGQTQSVSFCIDSRLNIFSWGKELEKISGKASSEVLGKPYYEVFPRICIHKKDAISIVLKEGKQKEIKGFRISCFYGGVKADIRINPLKDKKDRVKGVKLIFNPYPNCTMSQELEQLRPLIDIGKIASTLAHGVRNPLNAIKGAVVYLKEKYAEELIMIEFSRIIEEEISKLDSFISKFLSASIKKQDLSVLDKTNLNLLVKKIEVLTSLQTHTRNIEVAYRCGDVPPVMINSFHLEQAVMNVVNNAIEAMSSGGKLTVKTSCEKINGRDYVVIEVSDTGRGMPVTSIQNVSITTNDKGRGFGLFIARETMQYYGGQLEIKSKRGEGTTVRMCLPVKRKREVS